MDIADFVLFKYFNLEIEINLCVLLKSKFTFFYKTKSVYYEDYTAKKKTFLSKKVE